MTGDITGAIAGAIIGAITETGRPGVERSSARKPRTGAALREAVRRGIFTSLELPPTENEIAAAMRDGVGVFEFDLDQPSGIAASQFIKKQGGSVSAYHVGGGGGRAWGSVKAGEFVRNYRERPELDQLTLDVKRLVALGADAIHFDNTHRMSGRTLGKVTRAIVAGGAKLVLKNNPEKWNLVLKRFPEYLAHYAYAAVEGAIGDKWDTEQSAKLASRGIPVFIVAFQSGFDKGSKKVTPAVATAYVKRHPWATVILMQNEAAYDSRQAKVFRGAKAG